MSTPAQIEFHKVTAEEAEQAFSVSRRGGRKTAAYIQAIAELEPGEAIAIEVDDRSANVLRSYIYNAAAVTDRGGDIKTTFDKEKGLLYARYIPGHAVRERKRNGKKAPNGNSQKAA